MLKFSMFETSDKESLTELFRETGVKLTEKGEVLQCWAITYGEENIIVGGAVLSKIGDAVVLDGIAMKTEFRRIKLGKELVMMVLEKAIVTKAEALYAVARFPGFFKAVGFEDAGEDDIPSAVKEKASEKDEEGREGHILKIQFR